MPYDIKTATKDVIAAINNVPEVSNEKQYWYMRTMSGQFYNDFVDNNYVAIGYDEIQLKDIKDAYDIGHPYNLIALIKGKYEEERRAGVGANQLINFCYEMQENDIVIIPSISSSFFSIGRVVSKHVILKNDIPNDLPPEVCPFRKRKNVEWINKHIRIETIHPKLIYLKYTWHTLTHIDAELIEKIENYISPIYQKNGVTTVTYRIESPHAINGAAFMEAWLELFKLAEEFGDDYELPIKRTDYSIKINVESPGVVILTGAVVSVTVLACLVGIVFGIDIELEAWKFKWKLKMKGILKGLSERKSEKAKGKIIERIEKQLEMMQLNPDNVVDILKTLQNGNEDKAD